MGKIVRGLKKSREQESVYPAQAACYMCLVVSGSSTSVLVLLDFVLRGPRIESGSGTGVSPEGQQEVWCGRISRQTLRLCLLTGSLLCDCHLGFQIRRGDPMLQTPREPSASAWCCWGVDEGEDRDGDDDNPADNINEVLMAAKQPSKCSLCTSSHNPRAPQHSRQYSLHSQMRKLMHREVKSRAQRVAQLVGDRASLLFFHVQMAVSPPFGDLLVMRRAVITECGVCSKRSA